MSQLLFLFKTCICVFCRRVFHPKGVRAVADDSDSIHRHADAVLRSGLWRIPDLRHARRLKHQVAVPGGAAGKAAWRFHSPVGGQARLQGGRIPLRRRQSAGHRRPAGRARRPWALHRRHEHCASLHWRQHALQVTKKPPLMRIVVELTINCLFFKQVILLRF